MSAEDSMNNYYDTLALSQRVRNLEALVRELQQVVRELKELHR